MQPSFIVNERGTTFRKVMISYKGVSSVWKLVEEPHIAPTWWKQDNKIYYNIPLKLYKSLSFENTALTIERKQLVFRGMKLKYFDHLQSGSVGGRGLDCAKDTTLGSL